jgi:hypothetical protein
MIKLKSILQEAGLLKEQEMQSFEPVNFNFESGQYVLPQTELKKIDQVVSTVKDLVRQNYKIVGITIESSESQVPSARYKEKELAQKRGEAVKDILAKQLPEYARQINVVAKRGTTEYDSTKGDKPGDAKYKQEQYVRAEIKTDPPYVPQIKPLPLYRIALGFSSTHITFFCMENLKNYEATPVNEILGYVDKNIEKLSTAEGNELQYLDSYQWMRDNLTAKMRDSYSTAIYGSNISPLTPRSKPLVDLLKKYGATQSRINTKTKITLEDTTAKHAWFIYDERQIVNFFQQVSRDELDQIKDQTRK